MSFSDLLWSWYITNFNWELLEKYLELENKNKKEDSKYLIYYKYSDEWKFLPVYPAIFFIPVFNFWNMLFMKIFYFMIFIW